MQQSQNLREKIEAISLWQDVTQQTIRELQQSQRELPEEVSTDILCYFWCTAQYQVFWID